MAENVGSIYYTVEAKTGALIAAEREALESINRTTEGIKKAGAESESAAPKIKKSAEAIKNMGRATSDVIPIIGGLYQILSAAILIKTAKDIIAMSDAWTGLQNRLRLVTSGVKELALATDDVFRISQATSQEIDTIAQVYQRFAQNAEALGLGLGDVAEVTEVVAKAVAISGASAASAEAALVQLGQALASGVLRGEELNSVMEQTPGLAKAIADGLGITVGSLRTMAADGKITSAALIEALKKAGDSVEEQFVTRVKTASQAWVELQNSLTRYVGELSTGTAMSSQLADAITSISTAIDNADLDRMSQELEGVKAIISLVIDGAESIYEAFSTYFPEAASVMGLSMSDAALMLGKTADGIAETFTGTAGAIESAWKVLAYNIPTFFDNAWIKVKAGAADLVNGLADIINKPLKAIGVSTFGKVTFGAEQAKPLLSIMDEIGKGWDSAATSVGAYERTLARVTDKAIQSSVAQWQLEYSDAADKTSEAVVNLADEQSKKTKTDKAAAKAVEQNKRVIDDLSLALRLATLSGKDLAQAQALSKLNKFATEQDTARVRQLAAAIYELEEAERLRSALADADPAEALRQQFESQLSALRELNEAKLLEDERYLMLKEGLEREYAEKSREINEEVFAAQSWQNELVIKALNDVEQATSNALTGLLTGAKNSTEAIQTLAAGISQELVSALVRMGMEQVKAWAMSKMAQKAAAAGYVASVSGQVAANTALASQAAFASTAAIPIVGPELAPAAAAAAAAAASSLGAPAIPAASMTLSGNRLYGGPVDAGKMYRVNEDGRPEIYKADNGQQFIIPGRRGQVIPNGGGGAAVVNVSVVVNADGSTSVNTDTEGWASAGQEMGRAIRGIVNDELAKAMQAGGVIRSSFYG